MSLLQQQLQRLQQNNAPIKLKSKASVLFDGKQAAGVDRNTIFALATKAYTKLIEQDSKFSKFNVLFSISMKDQDRLQMTTEENSMLDKQLNEFLLCLSPYFLQVAAFHVLEWLVRRYSVHEYNFEGVLSCMLPYHETPQFGRVLEILAIEQSSCWVFLKPIQKAKASLPKKTLMENMLSDRRILAFSLKIYEKSKGLNIENDVLATFFASVLVSYYQILETIKDNDLRIIVPLLLKGLESQDDLEYRSTMLLLTAVLVRKVVLEPELLKKVILCLCKGMSDETYYSDIITLSVICDTQSVNQIDEKPLLYLQRNSRFIEIIGNLSAKYCLDKVIFAILIGLMEFETEQSANMVLEIMTLATIADNVTEKVLTFLFNKLILNPKSHLKMVAETLQNRHFEIIDSSINNVLNSLPKSAKSAGRKVLSSLYSTSLSKITESGNTLFLCLNHVDEKVRFEAVCELKTLLNSNMLPESELTHLPNTLQNLFTDSFEIVNELLEIKDLEKVMDVDSIVSILCQVAQNEKLKKLWWKSMLRIFNILDDDQILGNITVMSTIFGSLTSFIFSPDSVKLIKRVCRLINIPLTDTIESLLNLEQKQGHRKISLINLVIDHICSNFKEIQLLDCLKPQYYLDGMKSEIPGFKNFSLLIINRAVSTGKYDVNSLEIIGNNLLSTIKHANIPSAPESLLIENGQFSKNLLLRIEKDESNILLEFVTFFSLLLSLPKNNEPKWVSSGIPVISKLKLEYFAALIDLGEQVAFLIPLLLERYCQNTILEFCCALWSNINLGGRARLFAVQTVVVYLEAQKSGKGLDFQMIIPHLLIATMDPDQLVRKATKKAFGVVFELNELYIKKQGVKPKSELIYGKDTFYGLKSKDLQFLTVTSVRQFLLQIKAASPSFIADDDYLIQNLHFLLKKTVEKEKSLQDDIIKFLTSHILAGDSETFRTKMLLLLSNVDSTLKIRSLSPLIKPEFEKLNKNQNTDPILLILLISTFFVSECKSTLRKNDSALLKLFLSILGKFETEAEINVCKAFIQKLNYSWFDSVGSSIQQEIYKKLIQTAAMAPYSVSEAAKSTISSLTLSSEIVLPTIDLILTALDDSNATPKKSRGNYSMDAKSSILVTFLENIYSLNEFTGWQNLFSKIVSILERILSFPDGMISNSEYAKQMVLTVLEKILKNADEPSALLDESLRADVIVQCIRVTDNPQTHNAALLLLARISETHPQVVLINIMPVFTFMGANVLRQDDNYSFMVVQRTLETIVPALLKQDSDESPLVYIRSILDVFVNALGHIPSHRRLRLFKILIETVGVEEYLSVLIVLILSSPLATNDLNLPKSGETVNHKKFAYQLIEEFDQNIQFNGLCQILDILRSVPSEKSAQKVPAVLDSGVLSTRSLRLTKLHIIQFVNTVLSHKKVGDLDKEEFGKPISGLIESHILILKDIQLSTTENVPAGYAKFLKMLQTYAMENFRLINELLPLEVFLDVFIRLMEKESTEIKQKSLTILNDRLSLIDSTELVFEDFKAVSELLCKLILETSDHDDVLAIKTTSIECLASLMVIVGAEVPEKTTEFMHIVIGAQGLQHSNVKVRTISMTATSKFIEILGPRLIPYLKSIFPVVLKHIEEYTEGGEEDAEKILISSFSCFHAAFSKIPQFMSSFLEKLVLVLSDSRIRAIGGGEFAKAVQSLISFAAEKVEHRVIFSAINKQISTLIKMGAESFHTGLVFLNEIITVAKQRDLVDFGTEWTELFFTLFEFKKNMKPSKTTLSTNIEDTVVALFIKFTLKMNEKAFKPVMLKIVDWALGSENNEKRVFFFRLVTSLLDSLKSIFVPYWNYFFDNIIEILVLVKQNNEFSTLWSVSMTALAKMLSNDTIKFTSKERFHKLVGPLTDQIDIGDDEISDYKNLMVKHVVPALGYLAKACRDEACWKVLNKTILLKTRSENAAVRYVALSVISKLYSQLGEDMLIFFPETIPFLAEILEDEDPDVAQMCHDLTMQIQELLGEPIDQYFSSK